MRALSHRFGVGARREREQQRLPVGQQLRTVRELAGVDAGHRLGLPAVRRHAHDALAALAEEDGVSVPAHPKRGVGLAQVTAAPPESAILLIVLSPSSKYAIDRPSGENTGFDRCVFPGCRAGNRPHFEIGQRSKVEPPIGGVHDVRACGRQGDHAPGRARPLLAVRKRHRQIASQERGPKDGVST